MSIVSSGVTIIVVTKICEKRNDMEERRKINRVDYRANSIIVDRETQTRYYGQVKNISPLGIAIVVDDKIPSLMGKDVIVVGETMIMYADVVREENEGPGRRLIAFSSRKFTGDVLQYLFDHIGVDIDDEDDEE